MKHLKTRKSRWSGDEGGTTAAGEGKGGTTASGGNGFIANAFAGLSGDVNLFGINMQTITNMMLNLIAENGFLGCFIPADGAIKCASGGGRATAIGVIQAGNAQVIENVALVIITSTVPVANQNQKMIGYVTNDGLFVLDKKDILPLQKAQKAPSSSRPK